MSNTIHNNDIDDELDEVLIPKVGANGQGDYIDSDTVTQKLTEQFSNLDMSKFAESLKSKDPKELMKMFRKMGINNSQLEQMKKTYANNTGNLTTNKDEPDLRKRLRAKMNEMRMMRGTNTMKQQLLNPEGNNDENNGENNGEVSKKTLANRKKAQKKKMAKAKKQQENNSTETNNNIETEEVEEIEIND
jgi:hypothetical protein